MLPRSGRSLLWSSSLALVALLAVVLTPARGGGGDGGGKGRAAHGAPVIDGGRYFPFTNGSVWTYVVDESLGALGRQNYERVVRVTGPGPSADGESATFAHQASDEMESAFGLFLAKNATGVSTSGNDDAADRYTSLFVPYWEVRFDVPIGTSFVQYERSGVRLLEDYDADGQNDTGDFHSEVTLLGIEPVTVPAGSFAEALIVRRSSRLTIHFTTGGAETLTEDDRRWFAKDVGLVKAAWELWSESDGARQSSGGEELIGYAVGERSAGRLRTESLDDGLELPPATTFASDSAANSEGSLVVYCSAGESSTESGIFAAHVSALGVAARAQRLAAQPCNGIPPRVASDGEDFLVVFTRDNPGDSGVVEVAAARVSGEGRVLDPIPFPVSSSGVAGSGAPAVVFDGEEYIVLYRNGVTSLADEDRLVVSRVSPSGVVSAPVILDLAPGTRVPHSLDLDFDGANFLAVGTLDPRGSGATDIYGLRFDPTFRVLGGLFAISDAPRDQSDPAIAFDGENYLVVWVDDRDHPSPSTSARRTAYGTRVSPAGALLDGGSSAGAPVDVASFDAEELALAFDGSRFTLVGAASGRASLLRFGAAAWPLDGARHVARSLAESTDSSMLGVAAAGAGGKSLVAWADMPGFSLPGELYGVTLF